MILLTFFVLNIIFFVAAGLAEPSFTYPVCRALNWIKRSAVSELGTIVTVAASWYNRFEWLGIAAWLEQPNPISTRNKKVKDIEALAEQHELGEILYELIQEDGAGSWPPNANHDTPVWPPAFRPYMDIYLEMAPLLPRQTPSLNEQENIKRILVFRQRFRDSLRERVNLVEVIQLLKAADTGRWTGLTRDVYNAFYCCIASSRHAYRWATIPVVKVAQLEKEVNLPEELTEPWTLMQQHFGCASEAGNNTSNIVLKFNTKGEYMYEINAGMAPELLAAEVAFARIFYDVEILGVPIYCDMVCAVVAFSHGDTAACAKHVASVASQLRLVTGKYLENMHSKVIAQSIWLSRIQGFYAWGIGHFDADKNQWEKYDGLSGNQVLLFQALDAFLGIEQYLLPRDQERNVPKRQRELCHALRKHSFRSRLSDLVYDGNVADISRSIDAILKRLRLFRTAHRMRSKGYLSFPAPERLPMTAGKSLLAPNIEESLRFLDAFMERRLAQSVGCLEFSWNDTKEQFKTSLASHIDSCIWYVDDARCDADRRIRACNRTHPMFTP